MKVTCLWIVSASLPNKPVGLAVRNFSQSRLKSEEFAATVLNIARVRSSLFSVGREFEFGSFDKISRKVLHGEGPFSPTPTGAILVT
jgi:hypothetical protein